MLNQVIPVATSDGQIWNRDQTINEIIVKVSRGPVVLDLRKEGPSCQTSGIDDMLDIIVKTHGISYDKFLIRTSNQMSSSRYKELRTLFVELDYAKDLAQHQKPLSSTLEKTFGLFIGRSNWIRLGLASHLWNNYADQTEMTFHYNHQIDYHQANFGLEKLLTWHWDEIDSVSRFLHVLPMTKDTQTYPILWDQRAFDLQQQYKKIFCDIVCETYYTGRTFFMTEKTMRAIIYRRPFIVQGPQWYLRNLQQLGFKTFDDWWTEGYDQDLDNVRFTTLKESIDFVAQQSSATIKQWYQEMQPILEHNFNTLMQLTNDQILKTEFL